MCSFLLGSFKMPTSKRRKEEEEARAAAEREAELAIDIARLKKVARTPAGLCFGLGLILFYLWLLAHAFSSRRQAIWWVLAFFVLNSGFLGSAHVCVSVGHLWYLRSHGATERLGFEGAIQCISLGLLLHVSSVCSFGIIRLALIELNIGKLDRSSSADKLRSRPGGKAAVKRAEMLAARALEEFSEEELLNLRNHGVPPPSREHRTRKT